MTTPLAEILAEARDLGFLGPGSIERHLAHARGFAGALAGAGVAGPPQRVLDLGSGGGLPGLVLMAEWPGTRFTLLDAGARRADFLRRAVAALRAEGRATVVMARAEEAGRDPAHRGGYDLVVARSFGPPAVTAECAAAFLEVGGHLVTSEPPPDGTHLGGPAGPPAGGAAQVDARGGAGTARWPEAGLDLVGMVAVAPVAGDYRYHVVRQARAVGDRFPRRVGVPTKRPLF